MKHMKKIVALALVLMAVFAVTIPAFAKSDKVYRSTCATCGATAYRTEYYSRESIVGEERETRDDGTTYIRWCFSVPYTTECSTGNTSHVNRGGFKYWTEWQEMGN